MKYIICLFFLSLMLSCTASGPDYYREQGTALSRSLVRELTKIHSKEQFLDHQSKIESLFAKLKTLIYESDHYLKAHPEIEVPLFNRQNQEVSDALQSEINRLLRIEGCREILNQIITQNNHQNGISYH